MYETQIKRLLLAISIIGILLLLILVYIQTPKNLSESKNENDLVQVSGIVESINYKTPFATIYLQSAPEEIVIFSTKILAIKQGDFIQITGTTSKYQNKTQIVAEKILLLRRERN